MPALPSQRSLLPYFVQPFTASYHNLTRCRFRYSTTLCPTPPTSAPTATHAHRASCCACSLCVDASRHRTHLRACQRTRNQPHPAALQASHPAATPRSPACVSQSLAPSHTGTVPLPGPPCSQPTQLPLNPLPLPVLHHAVPHASQHVHHNARHIHNVELDAAQQEEPKH